MHIAAPKPPDAKLPLPPAEVARINRHRDILANLIENGNELALTIKADAMEEAALRKAARAAALAAFEDAQSPKTPAKPNTKPPQPPKPDQSTTEPDHTQSKPRTPRANPEAAFFYLVRAITTCMRMDADLADRLAKSHTTAELAGLNHPDRQDILNYLHNAARLRDPHEDRIHLHQDLETRVSQELGLFPDRNPGDIIGDLANLFGLPFDDADFPNNWRCETFAPPEPECRRPLTEEELAAITDEDLEEFARHQDEIRSRPRPRSRYHRRE